MQRDLWGNTTVKRCSFIVYHDESIPAKRWLLVGLLFVPEHRRAHVLAALRYHRDQESYYGEIHFSKLPNGFGGAYGAKARVARHWMRAYEDGLFEDAFFSVVAVDRHSSAYDPHRFSQEFHAYNRFTAMNVKAGIAWHLVPFGYDQVDITFISDSKDRLSQPDAGMVDNFEAYIAYRAELDSILARDRTKQFPRVSMKPIMLLDSKEEDLLQLTDLLVGASQEALVAGSGRRSKRELGRTICAWCDDLRRRPWERKFKMHRKFSFWAFPDAAGRPYNYLPFALAQDHGPSLFDVQMGLK